MDEPGKPPTVIARGQPSSLPRNVADAKTGCSDRDGAERNCEQQHEHRKADRQLGGNHPVVASRCHEGPNG